MEALSLYELNEYIQRVYALNFPEALWVNFELSNVKESRGHIYFDCIEKDDDSDEIIAHISGAIWRRQLSFIKKKLGKLADDIVDDGIKISAKVQVEFHPRYGSKLVIEDIDPAFTYGQLALERDKTIERLKKEGLWEINTQIEVEPVIQRIAIVSNDTAAGYHDFLNQLQSNAFGYHYDLTLFETALQGKNVEIELPLQLETIAEESSDFDLIVIIRGGGSRLDLSAFDSFKVAAAISNSPLPVWTGIGHEIDQSISDLVANKQLKTPTAVASALIEHNYFFESEIQQIFNSIEKTVEYRLTAENERLSLQGVALNNIIDRYSERKKLVLSNIGDEVDTLVKNVLRRSEWQLRSLIEQVELLDPISIMKKGFVLMEKDNKRVHSVKEVESGDSVTLHLSDGEVSAEITDK